MATFKVGQRVRITGDAASDLIGLEATITAIPNPLGRRDCRVMIDGAPCGWSEAGDGSWSAWFSNLAPLLPSDEQRDESAERFIESLKKLAREPLPLTKEKTV